MAENSGSNGNHGVALNVKDGDMNHNLPTSVPKAKEESSSIATVPFFQKIGELAGLAVGATVLPNVMFAGPISGASMNPARSLGPAIVSNRYEGIWMYILAPISGAVAGAWVYNIVRFTDKPLREIIKSESFIKASSHGGSNQGRSQDISLMGSKL